MWWAIAVWVVATIVSVALQPKQKAQPPGTFDVPTVEEGAPIGVLYGSGWIESPVIAWWGDTRTTPIKSSGGK